MGYIDYKDCAYVSEEIATSTKEYYTKPGDILISMTGSGPNAPNSLVGRVARVKNSDKTALINQRIGRIVPHGKREINLRFLFYVLNAIKVQEFLVANSSGSANQAP